MENEHYFTFEKNQAFTAIASATFYLYLGILFPKYLSIMHWIKTTISCCDSYMYIFAT